MGTFLQIVLAVILVLFVVVLIAWWWLKRKFSAAIEDFTQASSLLGPLAFRPARIQLQRSEYAEFGPASSAFLDGLKKLGFQRIADFDEYSGAYDSIQALRHRTLPVAAAVAEQPTGDASFVFFVANKSNRVVGRGNGSDASITAASLDWQNDKETTLAAAFKEISQEISDSSRPVDLRLFRTVYEQVYAVCMDQVIVHRPKREDIERNANDDSTSAQATEDQIDHAYELLIDHWKGQIEEAVLDRYRRTSKIDAVAWEDMRDWVRVVHSHLDDEDVEDMLVVDDTSEKLFSQCREQGLSGRELFLVITKRLPPDQQWTQVGEVKRPIPALLFKPSEDIDSDMPVARQYVYDAEDDDGKTIEGSVVAENSGDAKRQIANMGLRNAKLLIAPTPGETNYDELWLDDKTAAVAAKSIKEGALRTAGRALLSNWWIWAPPVYFIWQTINEGKPFSWGDYAVIAWTAFAVFAMIFFIGPIIFYNQLQIAQVKARPQQAKACLSVLRVLCRFGGMTPAQLKVEHCKILASDGELNKAMQLWEAQRSEMTEEEYYAGAIQIYDNGADWAAMIDAHHAFIAETPDKETAKIDLAMSIARHTENPGDAAPFIEAIHPSNLPEVGVIGYQYVRGLLAAHHGQHEQALRHYAQANETASQFVSIPTMIAVIAELNGHAALALKRLGKFDQAMNLWKQAEPILRLHKSSTRLIAQFEATKK